MTTVATYEIHHLAGATDEVGQGRPYRTTCDGVELAKKIRSAYPHALWENAPGLFDSELAEVAFEGEKILLRGIYPYDDEYTHLLIKKVEP